MFHSGFLVPRELTPVVFTKFKQISTSSKLHLPYFGHDAFVAKLIKYQKSEAMLTSHVKALYQHIHKGKINPSYKLHGTVTGRISSSDPNGTNVPKRGDYAAAYRECFVAPEGYVYVSADYSQIELRLVAIASKCKGMLEAYRLGRDLHCATAANIMGLSYDQFMELKYTDSATFKLKRYQAKACTAQTSFET